MRKLLVRSALVLPMACHGCAAEETGLRVFDALAGEYATCVAYHGMLSRSAELSGADGAAQQYAAQRDRAIVFALTYTGKGHGDADAKTLTGARIDAAIERLFAEIGGEIDRVPTLSDRYAAPCRQALDDPAAFADTVLERTAGR